MSPMNKSLILAACLASIAIVAPGTAGAQAKLTTEQAWAQCLKETDAAVGARNADNDSQRTSAFKACMAKLGHADGK